MTLAEVIVSKAYVPWVPTMIIGMSSQLRNVDNDEK